MNDRRGDVSNFSSCEKKNREKKNVQGSKESKPVTSSILQDAVLLPAKI